MLLIQPVYKDEHGVHRFLENKIVDDIITTGYNGGYILNEIYVQLVTKDDLDDIRHLMQMVGYSVSGFGDLSICYKDGSYDNEYDDYIDIIDNLPLTEPHELFHPISNISFIHNEETDEKYFKFVENKLFLKILDYFKIDIEKYLNDFSYSDDDKRQVLMLMGKTFTEFFEYSFNKIYFPCSGESGTDITLRGRYLDHYEKLNNEFDIVIKLTGEIEKVQPKTRPDMTFSRHEALHTTHILNCLIYEQLHDHTYYHSGINKKFNKEIELAMDHLGKAYQMINEDNEV